MKRYVVVIFLVCFVSVYVSAQHKNLEEIKVYYNSIDKRTFIDSLLRDNIECYKTYSYSYNTLNISVDSMLIEHREELANIYSDSSIIVPVLMLKNAEEYTFKKNIYDFVYVDTADIHIWYLDKRKGIRTILRSGCYFTDNTSHYKKELKDFQLAVEFIEKENPEVLFTFSYVFYDPKIRYNGKHSNDNYLYLKGDKIYVYRSKYKKVYELNQFVRKFFREKKFKERAIFDERSRVDGIVLYGGAK